MSRAERKARAIIVAEKAIEDRLDKIDWEEDVLYPLLDQVKAGNLKVTLEKGNVKLELVTGNAG